MEKAQPTVGIEHRVTWRHFVNPLPMRQQKHGCTSTLERAVSGCVLHGESSGEPCHCRAWHHADGSGLSSSETYVKTAYNLQPREHGALFSVPGDADAFLPTAGGGLRDQVAANLGTFITSAQRTLQGLLQVAAELRAT